MPTGDEFQILYSISSSKMDCLFFSPNTSSQHNTNDGKYITTFTHLDPTPNVFDPISIHFSCVSLDYCETDGIENSKTRSYLKKNIGGKLFNFLLRQSKCKLTANLWDVEGESTIAKWFSCVKPTFIVEGITRLADQPRRLSKLWLSIQGLSIKSYVVSKKPN